MSKVGRVLGDEKLGSPAENGPKDSTGLKNECVERAVQAEDLLAVLSDSYSRKILAATIGRSVSAISIAEENQIPLSTCYRRIRWLIDIDFLKMDRIVLTDDGKKYELFRSKVKSIKINFDSGKLAAEVVTV